MSASLTDAQTWTLRKVLGQQEEAGGAQGGNDRLTFVHAAVDDHAFDGRLDLAIVQIGLGRFEVGLGLFDARLRHAHRCLGPTHLGLGHAVRGLIDVVLGRGSAPGVVCIAHIALQQRIGVLDVRLCRVEVRLCQVEVGRWTTPPRPGPGRLWPVYFVGSTCARTDWRDDSAPVGVQVRDRAGYLGADVDHSSGSMVPVAPIVGIISPRSTLARR